MSPQDFALKVEHFQDDEDVDFRIASKKEMQYHLQGAADQRARIFLYYDNNKSFIMTSLLGVNEHGMWLDVGPFPPENKALLLSNKVTFVCMHQQAKIQFVTRDVDSDLFKNYEAFYIELPDYMLRIIRRQFYRITIPADISIKCIIPVPPKIPKEKPVIREFPIVEISGDGLGLTCRENEEDLLPGSTFRNCQIPIPDFGMLEATIVVRNLFDFTAPDKGGHKRAGCSLALTESHMNSLLQRYIIYLQGEIQRAKSFSLVDE